MAQQLWQILQATTTKELLFRCQTIITAIRLRRLVNLHLGITLWHQGEEPVLCSVHVQYVRLTAEGAEPPHRVDAGTVLTRSGASPGLKSPTPLLKTPTLLYCYATPSCGESVLLQTLARQHIYYM